MSDKYTISVCAIVKNEKKFLQEMLESIKDIADEIIITDTGSTDNTVDIAKNYTSDIYYYQWDNNFSNAKNFSLSKASKDWILCLDADERLIINGEFKHNLNKEDHVFSIIEKDLFLDGKEFVYRDITKLFPNFQGFKYSGYIHDFINRDKPFTRSIIDNLELLHLGFNRAEGKKYRNIEILKKEISEYQVKDEYYLHLLYLLGKEYFVVNDYLEGLKYYYEYIDSNPVFNMTNFISALTDLIKVFSILKRYEELEYYVKQYHYLLIKSPDFCVFYAIYLSDIEHNPQKAIFYLQKALYFKHDKTLPINYTFSSINYRPNLLIGINYFKLGKYNLSLEYLHKALEFNKDYNTIYYLVLVYSHVDKTKAENIIKTYDVILTEKEKIYLKQLIS